MKRTRQTSDKEEFLSKYYEKIFQFQNTGNWILPQEAYSAPKFDIPELQDLKHQLNHVKGKLNQFDLAEWSVHTRHRDAASFVMSQLRKKIKPELLTQAWCKFYELVSSFPLVPSTEMSAFRSLHLCEAPGAFISSLNHYLSTHYPNLNWKWKANTLNPSYEGNTSSSMIADDRLICYTRDRWQFGIDLTGDIMEYYNHCDIVNKNISEAKVSLVTADGSIDCMSDPGEQEKLVEFLHYCEAMTALAVLEKGGSFVLKIFTIFEHSTVCLMYLLNCIFDQVSVFKPCTSKGGNSELYVISNGYHGYDVLSSLWGSLINPYKNGAFKENASMFPLNDIPYSFQIQLISCCTDFFIEKQINVIEENIYYFLNPSQSETARLQYLKTNIAKFYMKKYDLKPIPLYRRIVPYLNLHDRRILGDQWTSSGSISFKDFSFDESINIVIGKQIEFVNNSKFVSKENLLKLTMYLNRLNHVSLLYSLILDRIKSTSIVINVTNFNLRPYYKYQKDLFNSLYSAVNESKNVILINLPFHTHFLAAVWCIFASAFEKVYFGIGWTVFHKPLLAKVQLTKSTFALIENAYNNIKNNTFSSDIVYVFQPGVFCSDLDFIPSLLNTCNTFYLPT